MNVFPFAESKNDKSSNTCSASGWIGVNYVSVARIIKICFSHLNYSGHINMSEEMACEFKLMSLIIQLCHCITARMMKPNLLDHDITLTLETIKLFLSIVLKLSLFQNEDVNKTPRPFDGGIFLGLMNLPNQM